MFLVHVIILFLLIVTELITIGTRNNTFTASFFQVVFLLFIENRMFFNIEKCHYISIHRSAENHELKIADTEFLMITSEKDFGNLIFGNLKILI